MATTEILPFGSGGSGTSNVLTQADYITFLATLAGNSFPDGAMPSAAQFNKILRQSSFISAGFASWVASQGVAVPDDGNLTNLISGINLAMESRNSSVRFDTNGTWVVPAGVKRIFVWGCGGGGGGGAGGGSAATFSTGAGGGGGGAGKGILLNTYAVTPGNSFAISIGAQGTPGIGVTGGIGGTGGAGGATTLVNTTFGTTLDTLAGGQGGGGGFIGALGTNIAGNAGGTGWPNGAYGSESRSNYPLGDGGDGAHTYFGMSGARGKCASSPGTPTNALVGYGYGAGGGGGGGIYLDGSNAAGGNGSAGLPGVLVIEW